ncbi:MAG: 6-phosphofructokinase [Acidimicrobiia bacterium]|nr:6-phosphofructokinase [Acidimicrobiia bacterium]
METIAVLTSGGDAPGMNAAIRAVVKVCATRGIRVLGVEGGYEGLIDGRLIPLTRATRKGFVPTRSVQDHGNTGGTFLGSARSKRFMTPEGRAEAEETLQGFGVDGLVVIGGNGSLTGARFLSEETGFPSVGIPATIDNDVGCTASAIGVDSALNTIVEACDRISDTAAAFKRAFIVEVMGRHSGYLATTAAIATAADAVLLPSHDRSADEVVETTSAVIRAAFAADRDKSRVLIMKAEGMDVPASLLARRLEESLDGTDIDVRATVLGHVQRGGPPSSFDRMIAGRMGFVAVEALLDGRSGVGVVWQATVEGGEPSSDPQLRTFPLTDILAETQAMNDGTSPVVQWRRERMEAIQGVLAL